MQALLISDLHVDFYCPCSAQYETLLPHFEDFFRRYMTPADIVCIAGDIANDALNQVFFLRFLSGKYGKVYCVLGNHDIIVKGGTFVPSPFDTSEERIQYVKEEAAKLGNVYILDGDVSEDGLVGGTMGMCDLTYRAPGWETYDIHSFWRRKWFDGRHWNYRNQIFPEIISFEMEKLRKVCERHPKIVMTHFCPLQMGIAPEYVADPVTAVFYFDAREYMDILGSGIWHCGHTHGTYDVKDGDIRIVCNPLGYPEEMNAFGTHKGAGTYLVEL